MDIKICFWGMLLSMGIGAFCLADTSASEESKFDPQIRDYLADRAAEFDQIPAERKTQLEELALFVKSRIEAGESARLTFICTHNSRRSQMAQVWAAAAAQYYGVKGVETFSGGTEATAFNPRTVAALKRAGLNIEKVERSLNPHYAVSYQETGEPLICFSKVYDQSPNPETDFCAVMTCSQADKSCPMVKGSSERIAVPYDDPKVADDTPQEAEAYDTRCQQICREMLYVMSKVAG